MFVDVIGGLGCQSGGAVPPLENKQTHQRANANNPLSNSPRELGALGFQVGAQALLAELELLQQVRQH